MHGIYFSLVAVQYMKYDRKKDKNRRQHRVYFESKKNFQYSSSPTKLLFNSKFFRDSILVVALDAVTSIFAGFAIFSILGHLAFILDIPVADAVKSGMFIQYLVFQRRTSSFKFQICVICTNP
jgi:Sodium:neurotransmitter symporter family